MSRIKLVCIELGVELTFFSSFLLALNEAWLSQKTRQNVILGLRLVSLYILLLLDDLRQLEAQLRR